MRRARRTQDPAGSDESVNAPVLSVVVVALVVGSRQLINQGVPAFGDFLSFGDSPRRLIRSYMSGWSDQGVGATRPAPGFPADGSWVVKAEGFNKLP